MITTAALSKDYGGVLALDGVDLSVPAGAVYGLVGPNGAGKTTLLSILAGLRTPTAGTVTVDRTRAAVLPDAPRFEPWLTGREVVSLALGFAPQERPTRTVEAVLSDAGLTDAADRRVGGYSRGMLQRLGLAATVVTDPEIVMLDEPAAALDPVGRRDVLDLVRRMRGRATVIFSSHILADVEDVCDWIGVLDHGRLRFQGPVSEVLARRSHPVFEIRVGSGMDTVAAALHACDWVTAVDILDDRLIRVTALTQDDADRELLATLAATGARVTAFVPVTPTLEDVFLELTR